MRFRSGVHAGLVAWVTVVCTPVLGGCSSAKYRVERPQLDCDDANGLAHRALVGREYEITSFELATTGTAGVIAAERETPEGRRRGRVRIDCREGAAAFQPVEGAWFLPDFEFSREVYYAILALAGPVPAVAAEAPALAAAPTPEARLRVIMHPLDRFATRKSTGADLTERGLLVVRVEIGNGTARAYRLPPGGIVLADADGNRIEPLAAAGVTRILEESAAAVPAPEARPLPPIDIPATVRALESLLMTFGRVGPGATREGLLYFPAGAYRSGRVRLIDEETQEVEGVLVGF
jgi:hypothetical protein